MPKHEADKKTEQVIGFLASFQPLFSLYKVQLVVSTDFHFCFQNKSFFSKLI